MKRFFVLFILGCYFAVFINTSLQMYSIEAGKLYTESFNINHVLIDSSAGCFNTFELNKDSMSRDQESTHFHILKLNSQSLDNGNGMNVSVNILPAAFPSHLQSHLHVSQLVPSTDFFTKLKILPPGHSYLSDSVVIRV